MALSTATPYRLAGTICLRGVEQLDECKVAIEDVVEWTGERFSLKPTMPTALRYTADTKVFQARDGQCIRFSGLEAHAAPPLPAGTFRLLFSASPEFVA